MPSPPYPSLTACASFLFDVKFKRKGGTNVKFELTKDADKLIVLIYKEYLSRRKEGISKSKASNFEKIELQSLDKISTWLEDDLEDTLAELHEKGLITMDLSFTFDITDSGIIYLENRFKNDLIEVTDFISKFIP